MGKKLDMYLIHNTLECYTEDNEFYKLLWEIMEQIDARFIMVTGRKSSCLSIIRKNIKKMRFVGSFRFLLVVVTSIVFCFALRQVLLLHRSDSVILSRSKFSGRNHGHKWRHLPVQIVEEHHEVLPYWFEAADNGRIGKDVTLIHIDGHSDLASNFYLQGYPFFEWPLSEEDMKLMMQRNDGFITAAAMAGLINHVVWVWPKWDQVNHNYTKSSGTIQLGWTVTQQSSLGNKKDFCQCIVEEGGQKFCMFTSVNEKTNEVEMEEDLCVIRRTITFTEIMEDEALEYLESMNKNVDIILDIDEDFFGCEYASQPLYDYSIPDLGDFDVRLNELFCPSNQPAEIVLDNLLVDLMEYIKNRKCMSGNKHVKCNSKVLNDAKYFFLKRSNVWRSHICDISKEKKQSYISGIIREFFKLNKAQLSALQRVGFCLSTTFKTYQELNPSVFATCRGANSPNETAVTEHRTNEAEVRARGKLLSNLLHVFRDRPPNLVTVCRSIRDGYTPRKYFKYIEYLVLHALRTNFHKVRVHYDSGLLNGKTGFRQS